jgi:hypothetical protein
MRQQAMESMSIEITPSLSVRWCPYSRLVNLCAPLEVRSESDLSRLVALTRQLLTRELTIADAFPGYRYTNADWEQENLHLAGADLHTHKIYP